MRITALIHFGTAAPRRCLAPQILGFLFMAPAFPMGHRAALAATAAERAINSPVEPAFMPLRRVSWTV
jgi:hypothetical protein